MKKTVTVAAILFTALVFLLAGNAMAQKKWDVPAKYKSMKMTNPSNAGKELFSQYCKSCHGPKGEGNGPKAATLKTPIPSFKNLKTAPDGEVYFKSFVGMDEMPNFEKKITNEGDRWAIVKYIKSL